MHPSLAKPFEALEQQRNALFSRLEKLPEEALHARVDPQSWSSLQHLRHLIMAEQASLSYLRKKLEHNEGVHAAGLGGRIRSLLLRSWFLLGRKAKAPKIVADPPFGEDPQSLFSAYAALRSEWAEQLEAIPPELVDKALFKHQIAGRMSLSDALRFFQTHFQHHQKGMERILQSQAGVQL